MATEQETSTKPLATRQHYLDLLKILAVFFVVNDHTTTYTFDFLDDPSVVNYGRYFLRTLLAACIPIFFFANGYLLLNKNFDLRRHIRKTVRIAVITMIWAVITTAIIMVLRQDILTPAEFARTIWTWRVGWTNHLWFMGALVCIYVFFPLLKTTFDYNRTAFLYVTIVLTIVTIGNTFINDAGALVLSLATGHVPGHQINWFNMFNPVRGIYGYTLAYFCWGGVAYHYKDKILAIPAVKRNILAVIAIIVSCGALFFLGVRLSQATGEVWNVIWDGLDSVPALITTCALYVLTLSYQRPLPAIGPVVQKLTRNTLGVYYIHPVFITIFSLLLAEVAIVHTFTGNLVVSIAVIGLSLGTALVIKRIPGARELLRF